MTTFTINIMGESGSGKTSFLRALEGKEFKTEHIPSTEPESSTIKLNTALGDISLQFNVVSFYSTPYPKSSINVYFAEKSTSDKASIKDIKTVLQIMSKDTPYVLCITKSQEVEGVNLSEIYGSRNSGPHRTEIDIKHGCFIKLIKKLLRVLFPDYIQPLNLKLNLSNKEELIE